ncbi:Hypothetical predicted protein [Podarcis lilfordi]|uniref:Uncharacterized protein n=1 Tax=Podarcis lilfordi TaxID=74358 RepID=A0AA35JPX5_9SAUR|nr:Hypothetical predicted protein [Podarcis lilfordi]
MGAGPGSGGPVASRNGEGGGGRCGGTKRRSRVSWRSQLHSVSGVIRTAFGGGLAERGGIVEGRWKQTTLIRD